MSSSTFPSSEKTFQSCFLDPIWFLELALMKLGNSSYIMEQVPSHFGNVRSTVGDFSSWNSLQLDTGILLPTAMIADSYLSHFRVILRVREGEKGQKASSIH